MKTVFEFIQEMYTDRPLWYNTLVYDNDGDLIISDQHMADTKEEIAHYSRAKADCYKAAEQSHNTNYKCETNTPHDGWMLYTFEFGVDDIGDPLYRWTLEESDEADTIEYIISSSIDPTTKKRVYGVWAPSDRRFDKWYSTCPAEFDCSGCSGGSYDSVQELIDDWFGK